MRDLLFVFGSMKIEMRFRRTFTILCAFLLHGAAFAAGTEPERILLTWDGDPARTQAVSWRTSEATSGSRAQIAPAQAGPKLEAVATTVSATSIAVDVTTGTTVHYHTVAFRDLKPSSKYAYRLGDGVTWSEWNHFNTASDKPEPFTFLYVGDAQNDVKSLWSRVIRDAFRHGSQARFILHAGDLINLPNADNEWQEWFEAAGWINRVVPSVAIPGNHEYAFMGRDKPRELSKFWRPQFEYPKNGPAGLEDTAYYIDYQGVRIIGLDTNVPPETQTDWLEGVLKENPNRWTILTFHHPIYSAAARRDNPHIRAAWMPLIDKYRVDLVLQGHDHTYARSQKLTSGTVVGTTGSGAVYVVSVSGSKMYNVTTETANLMARMAEDTQLYQLLTIKGDTISYEARTAAGDLYDAFDLQKGSPSEGNRLINKIPETAERRRVPRRRDED